MVCILVLALLLIRPCIVCKIVIKKKVSGFSTYPQRRHQQHELRTAETDERRKNRLKCMRDHEHGRRAAETSEQREDMLQRTRGHCQERR